ncbi:Polygalacturonase [Amphibacillus marinus]|uniref:Polygalacturonase n=1 Tax=Amphibacillus marinus TaxID=872970 RepID=A0A1H8RBZ1_9BACI|nr:glycosyl hydrolase family 28 protein [Amphibacillus marinus]SEO63503.1 Polygalacturonase [Amphibacillus marinus]
MALYKVTEFGAKGDGQTVDTVAIQATIDYCHEHGGGQVAFAQGTFVMGTVFLKSNVYLHIDASATILANPDISDYPDHVHYNRYVNETEMDKCLIYAEDAMNIGLIGLGRIDGNAEAFPNEGSIYRPMMVRFLRCQHIHLKDLRLHNSTAWTTAFLDSENIWCENLDINNSKRYNGDGLDFDGCQYVFITNCKIKGTDDNLCLQSSSTAYPMRHVHITNCYFTSICAAIRIGLKSIGTISNVTISNCTFENVWREGVKIECTEGGQITDIMVKGLVMRNVRRPIFVLLNNRLDRIGSSVGLTKVPEIGTMARIHFSDIMMTDDEEMTNTHYRFTDDVMGEPSFNGIRVDANTDYPIQDLTMNQLMYTSIGGVTATAVDKQYPQVWDMRYDHPEQVSENYFPNWSRTTFFDIRHVDRLVLSRIRLRALRPDSRDSYLITGCNVLAQDIVEIENNSL